MSKKSKLAFVTFLTFVRFPLVLLFFAGAIVYNTTQSKSLWMFALIFTALVSSALTDLLDGYFARKFKVVTQFGSHVDPLMDKFFYLASLPLLVFLTAKNGMASPDHNVAYSTALLVLTLFFLARDQWVTFLRSIGSLYNVSGKANWSGKLRTAINFPMICVVYYCEEAPQNIQFLPIEIAYILVGITIILTIISLFVYNKQYWPYLKKAASVDMIED
jgi:CDP-diacylglycerol--glycerol-3-phosphate 3-phosphatidyltransferase